MTDSEQSVPRLIAVLESFREGQERALYNVRGRVVEVSTVPNTGDELDELLATLGCVIGPGDPSAEYAADRDPTLEETMAFPCRTNGKRIDAQHIVAAQGAGSRARVLEMLGAGTSWRKDWRS